jgi:hypothetical protein
MRFLATLLLCLAALFAALILIKDAYHSRTGDRRHASFRTIVVSVLFLLGLSIAAHARPSPYPPVTQFIGDRYGAAQLGPEVTRAIGCPPPACVRKTVRKRAPVSRQRWQRPSVPLPHPRASEAYRADMPLSLGGGIRREAARVIGGRPAGCPHRFCGCGASLHLFGRIIPALNLAANWLRFPRAEPAPRMVAARRGHVFVLERHIAGLVWLVHDSNSGGHRTRIHPRSIAGYAIVNPRGST